MKIAALFFRHPLVIAYCYACSLLVSSGMQGAAAQLSLPPSSEPAGPIPVLTRHLSFEIVSIRPSSAGSPRGGFSITPDGYQQTHMPLVFALMMAYLPMTNIPIDRIKGVPSWVTDDPYDIVAKISPNDVPVWQSLRQSRARKAELEFMLQRLLSERCHLVAHEAPDMVSGYGLTIKKVSAALRASDPQVTLPSDAIPIEGGASVVPPRHGSQKQELRFYHASMSALASQLTQDAKGVLIEDHTGLKGRYDFTLSKAAASPTALGDDLLPNPDYIVPWDVQAIGLQLKPMKVGQLRVVVDHIDRPTPN